MSMVMDRVSPNLSSLVTHASWLQVKDACITLQGIQAKDGSVPRAKDHALASSAVSSLTEGIDALRSYFAHHEDYLRAVIAECQAWEASGFGTPDFYDSLNLFHPEQTRVDGTIHLVVFPMYTQNGSTNRFFEAVLCQTIWPDFVSALEADHYRNALFVPVRFLDYTPGYDTNSAVLFPESVAVTPRVPDGSPEGT